MNSAINIASFSTSTSPTSRSRLMIEHTVRSLRETHGCHVDHFDLAAEAPLPNYPHAKSHELVVNMRRAAAQADALVFAGGIYMWRPNAGLYAVIEYALDPDARRGQPMLMHIAAGTIRSHLAADSLATAVAREIAAIPVVPPILGTAEDFTDETVLTASLRTRLDEAALALVHHARAARQLRLATAVVAATAVTAAVTA